MGKIIIDRRKNARDKGVVNRQKFVKRVRNQVREAIKGVIRDGSIKDIIDTNGKKIRIPGKGLAKPTFGHAVGGVHDMVHAGNKQLQQGDRITRPPKDEKGGGGSNGSPDGDNEEDGFLFELSKEEFLDMFFDELELPDMVKKTIMKTDEFVSHRAGFSVDGNPARLNIARSMRQSKGRRVGLAGGKKRKLKALILELDMLVSKLLNPSNTDTQDQQQNWQHRIDEIKNEIITIRRKIKAIPFIDDIDLRFNRWERTPQPTTQAVMFGIMDVSASMGDWEKEMAKRFFMLMLLFLSRNYEKVDIVWIRHHTMATEVDEDEFFHSTETGGTIVSSALQLMKEIINDKYPKTQWNVFATQISDGDNWSSDDDETISLLEHTILPACQYFCYVEVNQDGSRGESDLWPQYTQLKTTFNNMAMTVITDVTEIYPTFVGLFEKRD